MKNKQSDYYLLIEDIEELNNRYGKLYKQLEENFKNKQITQNQINEASEVLLNKYKFEINELNDLREAEYKTRQAEIKARNDEQIPWRRGWWWRLLFQPVTNRAQDIIEERAALEAEELFITEEKKLKAITGESKLSKRKRKRYLKKLLKYQRLLNADVAEPTEPTEPTPPATAEPAEPAEAPPPPVKKPRAENKG